MIKTIISKRNYHPPYLTQYMADLWLVEYIISCLSPVGRSAHPTYSYERWENGREHGSLDK